MNIDSETPRVTARIAGIEGISIPAPFVEGHVCTAGEAAALNQTLRENISNLLRKQVVEADPPMSLEAVQALVDEKLATYEFGVRSGGGGRAPADPVLREAHKLIREAINLRARQQGKKLSKETMAQLVETVFSSDEAKWRKNAEAEIARRQKSATAHLGELSL